MKNIDTIWSTFLTGYIKCNTKTHLLVSRYVKLFFFFYLSVGIYRIIIISNREGSDTQTDLLQFFLISKLH